MQVVYLSGYLLYCALLRVQLERVDLFASPCIYRHKFGDIDFRLGALPFTVSVFPVGLNDPPELGGKGLSGRSRFLISGLWVSSTLALFFGGIVMLGWPEFARQVASGFGQLLGGAVAPATKGKDLVEAYFKFADERGFLAGVGVICAKHASLCLLPIPGQNLVNAALAALPKTVKWQPGKDRNSWESTRFITNFGCLGLLLSTICSFAWLYAIGAATHSRAQGEDTQAWLLLGASAVVLFLALRTRDQKLYPKPAPQESKDGSDDVESSA